MPQPMIASHPFALMMDPAAVIAAMERSERLAHLQSRICRPLDKVVAPPADPETASFDGAVDAAEDRAEPIAP